MSRKRRATEDILDFENFAREMMWKDSDLSDFSDDDSLADPTVDLSETPDRWAYILWEQYAEIVCRDANLRTNLRLVVIVKNFALEFMALMSRQWHGKTTKQ